jgi:spectinomycin phosphotransferase
VPAMDGETVWPVNKKYAVAVYPYMDGVTGQFGQPLPARARAELVGMLAALHQVTPTSQVPAADIRLPSRDALEAALG